MTESSTAPSYLKIGADLRVRAAHLRRNASWILAIIVVVLLAGIGVFVAAGTLVNRETTSAVEENRRIEFDKLQRERADAVKDMMLLNQQLAEKEKDRDRQQLLELRDKLTAEFEQLGKEKLKAEVQFAEIDQRIAALGTLTDTPKDVQLVSLISTISTRIGAIVLLLFLVQILTPLYRYNVRLAAHYHACADAADLMSVSNVSLPLDAFALLVAAISPAAVEFGSAPVPPTEQAFRVIAEALARK